MTWLVTGGAGYIGAHVVRALERASMGAVALDDLSSGRPAFVAEQTPLVEASVLDTDALRRAMREYGVTGVVHLAGFKYAGVSVDRPLHTYDQNVLGTISLLRAMAEEGVEAIVFSSSASVYGTPATELVTEQTELAPESPYGRSKLVGEWLVADQARATGLRHTSLRYFNVVGSGDSGVYDASPHNLFPMVLEALLAGETPRINGDDYPTPDGTCVRDYVHVVDLAQAHVAAARALATGGDLLPAYNLGSGTGSSVRDIMTTMAQVTGIAFDPRVGPRRPGDPARIVASGKAAARDLDWQMRHTLTAMVDSAWRARRAAD
jgi:UDP-glucose 4-epimerase